MAKSSSAVSRVVSAGDMLSHRHDYPAYETTSHTHLVQNQQIATVLRRWLEGLFEA